MKIFMTLFYFICFFTNELIAQNQSNNLYIERVDSIIKERRKQDNSLIYNQFKDTANNRIVIKLFEKDKLVSIYYVGDSFFCSESATYYMQNGSLIYVEHTLSGPDIRSSRPPSTTYSIYFKNDAQIHSTISSYPGEIDCTHPLIEAKEFVKEFYYYKNLNVN